MMRQPKEIRPGVIAPSAGAMRSGATPRTLSTHVVSDSGSLRDALNSTQADPSDILFSFSTRAEGMDPLLAPGLDALVVDIGAGGPAEMAFLARVIALGPDAPVVAVGQESPEVQTAAIEAGAEDCVGANLLALKTLTLAIRRAVSRRKIRDGRDKRAVAAKPEPQMTLVQESSDAMVILDSQGNVRFANNAAEELMGRKASELVGKPFGLPTEPGEHEIALVRPDGENRLAEMRIVDTRWGGVPARVAALNDVTVRRRLERTIQAAEAQSRETKKRTQTFFSNVNHDLRTPLTHIIGFSELMKNEQFGPMGQDRYRDYARDIHASGRMLLDMIEDLLGIAEAETDQLNLTDEICNIGQLLEIAVASQKAEAGKDGIKIEIDCPPKLPGLRGDAKRLRQGLFRLVAEAVLSARRGSTLKLGVAERDGRLELSLTEIPADGAQPVQTALPYTFGLNADPFVSPEDSGTAREESLALSLTRKVMELHGGTVSIRRGDAGAPMSVSLSFPAERTIR
jgi:signal transduction histidine kinase/DNA-binding NarL/FixJ family response regulator